MNKRSVLVVLSVCLLIFGAVAFIWISERRQASRSTVAVSSTPAPARVLRQEESKPPTPVPAFQSEAAALSVLPPTLSPEMFDGAARAAYTIAREIPETLAQVPCYCHCDRSKGHKSLHSCFIDDHGANCGICMNEAMAAYKLKKEQKLSANQIRDKIIAEFSKQY